MACPAVLPAIPPCSTVGGGAVAAVVLDGSCFYNCTSFYGWQLLLRMATASTDGSCFYARVPGGSKQLAKKREDWIYHMEREVTTCRKEVQLLIDLVDKQNVLIVTPIPRYITAGCCGKMDYVSNRLETRYMPILMNALEGLLNNLKNSLSHSRMCNAKFVVSLSTSGP
jgi:hypothetical protein